jgi:hypothetical protein
MRKILHFVDGLHTFTGSLAHDSMHRTIGVNTLQLPKKLDTLKKRVRGQLPMLRLMRKPIRVAFEKLPALPAGEKQILGSET